VRVGTDHAVEDTVRSMLKGGELDLPVPAQGRTARRWASLASWGRSDLAVARLAEGHADAVSILIEAGLSPLADALYGVWAARPGGLGARLATDEKGRVLLHGRARFCSGARMLDRALVVAEPEAPGTAPVLVEVELDRARARPDPESWQAGGMAGSDTLDVEFFGLPVQRSVGGPGWYTERPGFVAGGGGVAAVWWGGAAGVLHRAFQHVREAEPDQHKLAYLGELHALLTASHALLRDTADELDAAPRADHSVAVATVRCAVERSCRETIDRAPRILGPGIWSGDRQLAAALADLQMYVRQHHGERDSAALAEALLREPAP
jgi:hypothetical protein